MLRWTRLLLVVLAVAALGAACGGDDDDAGGGGATDTATTAAPAPEDLRPPASEVSAGLQQIDGIVQQAAAAVGTDQDQATELAGSVTPIWFSIEGTIKANDVDTYLNFEDAFAGLNGAAQKGDTARAATIATNVSQYIADYLAKYPA